MGKISKQPTWQIPHTRRPTHSRLASVSRIQPFRKALQRICVPLSYGPIFSHRERLQIFVSDIGVLAVLYGFYRLAVAKGLAWVICFYRGPVMVVNGYLVLITYLQHTHPHCRTMTSKWDWFRGALPTVDRDYGILNKVFHNITDTHVAHHLFSTMPQYQAMEETKAINPILGEYYQFDGTPVHKAMFREVKECIYIEPDEGDKKGVFWYDNKL